MHGSVQVNQVGFATSARKTAFAGAWLGDAGGMPVSAKHFELIDTANDTVVFRGPLRLTHAADSWSGNDVHIADFSSFQTPGSYRLRVAGLGVSDVFRIDDDVYDQVYRRVSRLFYHSRNSMRIEAPWSDPGFERSAGVPVHLDGIVHPRVFESRLGAGPIEGNFHPVAGGWFDAGDYGQYVTNAAPVWYQIGAAMDLAPLNFEDGDLNIPESGNGIPDILDELEWGMSWALSMQSEDGGVFWRIASQRWDSGLPGDITRPRLIAERTTHATAVFAAMASISARLIRQYRPDRAASLESAARAAWRFIREEPQWPPEGEGFKNPEGVHAGEYPDLSAVDAIAWAAAEMFRLTGEREFLDAFETRFRSIDLDPTAPVSFRDQGMAAAWAYLMTPDPRRDPELAAQASRAFIAGADWRLRQMETHPFRAPQHPASQLTGWGNFAHSTRATLPLLQAWLLSDRDAYRLAAWETPGPQLGANPQALSYITGVGARYPANPLSKLSQYDQVREPLPGIPVNGPHYHLPALWPETRAVNDAYFPPGKPPSENLVDGYPALRRYTDSEFIPPMSEPTVAEIATTAIAFGLLRDQRKAFGPKVNQAHAPRVAERSASVVTGPVLEE